MINATTTPPVAATALVVGPIVSTDIVKGDDSFEGVYRLYAYLNPLGQRPEALDIGQTVEPGSSSSPGTTKIGPVIVKFNPTNGILTAVNGTVVPTGVGATVPDLTIRKC